jgi:hypothetical protein
MTHRQPSSVGVADSHFQLTSSTRSIDVHVVSRNDEYRRPSRVKHAAIGVSAVVLLLAVLYCAWVRADAKSRERVAFAAEMTRGADDHIIFYASGPLNKQLTIVPEYAESGPSGQVDCDGIVDYLIHDDSAMPAIKQKGFTSLRCGDRQVQSWPTKFGQ